MAQSALLLVKNIWEFLPKDRVNDVQHNVRGLYVLYDGHPDRHKYDVLYVGMARGGVRNRLLSHARTKLWSHFSIYEVWDNIRDEQIEELEGLLRHIYRHDSTATRLNIKGGFDKARSIRQQNLDEGYKVVLTNKSDSKTPASSAANAS